MDDSFFYLRRGDKNSAIWFILPQLFNDRNVFVRRPRRSVDDEVVDVCPADVSQKLFYGGCMQKKQVTAFLCMKVCCSFIHSGYFYSASSNPLLLIGAPDYSIDTVSELTHQSATVNCEWRTCARTRTR